MANVLMFIQNSSRGVVLLPSRSTTLEPCQHTAQGVSWLYKVNGCSDVFDGIPAELEVSMVGAVAAQDWRRYDEEVLGPAGVLFPAANRQLPTAHCQLPSVAKHAWGVMAPYWNVCLLGVPSVPWSQRLEKASFGGHRAGWALGLF